MRDWFAAFAPDQNAVMPETRATRATRATETRKGRKSADSGWRHTEDGKGNKWATRATEACTDPHAEHSVAHVAQVLPKQKQSSEGARSPENQSLVPPVAHVAYVALHSDEVRTETPESAWTAEDWRAFFDERAGILEYDHDLSRHAAARRAFECTVVEWQNQHPEPSDPGHCVWCGAAENSDARVVPYGTNPVDSVWLHPGCWDPWYRERRRKAKSALTDIGIFEVSR